MSIPGLCSTIPVLASLGIALAASRLESAPEIAVVTEPAWHGEPAVVTGEGFGVGKTVVKAMALGSFSPGQPDDPLQHLQGIDRVPELPATPPAGAFECKVLGGGEGFLQIDFRCVAPSWLRIPLPAALWVGDGTSWSQPYFVNRPQAHWLYPQVQAAGEIVRVFGRTFAWGHQMPTAVAVLRRVGARDAIVLRPASQHHEDGHSERWSLAAWLPSDLEPGPYELFVHGRAGGAHGWSEPLPLTIAAKPSAPRPLVDVRSLGAKGDGCSDDTGALEAALKQAAPGGTVLLPCGVYAISHTLEIPEDVIIQGTSRHQSVIANRETPGWEARCGIATRTAFDGKDLLHGMKRFALRDLTLRFMPAQGAALRVGKDPEWSEDVSLIRVRLETLQDYSLSSHPYVARPLNIVKARRFSMVRCETYGPGGVSCERKVEDSLFAQNRFETDRRWRGHNFKFWGAERVIFEDNHLSGDTRGLVMQTHFGVNYRNFIAGNTVERTVLGGNAGETYLVEGSGYLFESRVRSAGDNALVTQRWPEPDKRPLAAADCTGRFAVIGRGRGLGQWRRITGCDPVAHELQVDKPWRVRPDATSVVVVMNGLIETVFVNNQEIDCAKGLYLYYAGAIQSIVDRHLCDRTLGVTLMTQDERQEPDPSRRVTAPDFFNLVVDCRVHDGGGIVCGAGGRLPLEPEPDAPLANFGNRFFANEVQNVAPFSGAQYEDNWTWRGGWSQLMAGVNVIPMDLGQSAGSGVEGPPRITGAIFYNNWISGAAVGAGVSRRASHTLFSGNVFQEVKQTLVDGGQDTRELDSKRGDEDAYTPERGPIR